MKAYFFILNNINTTTFSNTLFANALKNKGFNINIVTDLNEKYSILQNCDADIIFFQKTIQCPAHTSKYISHLKGKVFLCHIDDDFLDMHSVEHINTLNISDLILVGSDAHKHELINFTNTPAETIHHLLDDENYQFLSPLDRNNDPIIICWQQAWADAYVKDLLSVSNAFKKLHDKYNIQLDLYGWHMGIDYRDLSGPVRAAFPYANFIPYEKLDIYNKVTIPKLRKSDICISPYVNIPDRIGKAAFGLKRIMLLGVPIVATTTQHHSTLIKDGINGYLASTEDEWFDKLEALILSKDLRYTFAVKSRSLMEDYYNENASITLFINHVKKYFPNFTVN